MPEKKERMTFTLDAPLVRRMKELVKGKREYSAFMNKALAKHLETFDEQLDLNLQKDLDEVQAKIAKRNAEKKQKLEEEEAKKREDAGKLAEALKEVEALNLDCLTDSEASAKVCEIAAKNGFSWENNMPSMDALMTRVWEKREESRRRDY